MVSRKMGLPIFCDRSPTDGKKAAMQTPEGPGGSARPGWPPCPAWVETTFPHGFFPVILYYAMQNSGGECIRQATSENNHAETMRKQRGNNMAELPPPRFISGKKPQLALML